MVIHDEIDFAQLFGDDDGHEVAATGPEVIRRPVRATTRPSAGTESNPRGDEDSHHDVGLDDNDIVAQTLNDDDMTDHEAQQVSMDALATVLPELREHLMRSVAWIDEVMDALSDVSRGR